MINTPTKSACRKLFHFSTLSLCALNSVAFASPLSALSDGTKIVGGEIVTAADPIAKSTVALEISVPEGTALCTGSIIADDLIVTAAHCVQAHGTGMRILFGLKSNSSAITRKASDARVPQEYQGENSTGIDQYDIGLVRFPGGLPAGYVAAQVLPESIALADNESVTLSGYGITDGSTHAGSGTLRKTDVKIKIANYGRTEVLLDQSKGHGACHGDSGGPAVVKANGNLYVWGVTNRGAPDDAPDDCLHEAVYTKINAHTAWLGSATQDMRRPTG